MLQGEVPKVLMCEQRWLVPAIFSVPQDSMGTTRRGASVTCFSGPRCSSHVTPCTWVLSSSLTTMFCPLHSKMAIRGHNGWGQRRPEWFCFLCLRFHSHQDTGPWYVLPHSPASSIDVIFEAAFWVDLHVCYRNVLVLLCVSGLASWTASSLRAGPKVASPLGCCLQRNTLEMPSGVGTPSGVIGCPVRPAGHHRKFFSVWIHVHSLLLLQTAHFFRTTPSSPFLAKLVSCHVWVKMMVFLSPFLPPSLPLSSLSSSRFDFCRQLD